METYASKLNEESIKCIKNIIAPLVPIASRYFTSQQLTLASLIWSFLLVLSGYLALKNKCWFFVSIFALIMHIITDLLDGCVSEYNNDGMGKWNFFMDHLLDFTLTIAVFLGLALYFYKKNPTMLIWIFISFSLIIVNMVASFLMVSEQGLDLGICLNECFTFNIFHMHFIIILFYVIIMITPTKKLGYGFVMCLSICLFVLTCINIHSKQEKMIQVGKA